MYAHSSMSSTCLFKKKISYIPDSLAKPPNFFYCIFSLKTDLSLVWQKNRFMTGTSKIDRSHQIFLIPILKQGFYSIVFSLRIVSVMDCFGGRGCLYCCLTITMYSSLLSSNFPEIRDAASRCTL